MDKLHSAIQKYVEGFYLYHDHLRTRSLQIRIPIIIFSAIATGVSFVNISIESKYANLFAGSSALIVTILTGVEGYLKYNQHINATENALKCLGRLSRKVYAIVACKIEPSPDNFQELCNELGNAMEEAPIIPAKLYMKLKPLIDKRILYSTFDENIEEEKEYELPSINNKLFVPGV